MDASIRIYYYASTSFLFLLVLSLCFEYSDSFWDFIQLFGSFRDDKLARHTLSWSWAFRGLLDTSSLSSEILLIILLMKCSISCWILSWTLIVAKTLENKVLGSIMSSLSFASFKLLK